MTLKNAYEYCHNCLNKNGIDEADFKSLCLVCSLANIKNSEYNLKNDTEIEDYILTEPLLRLLGGEPLQYVLGKWDFFESEFYVGEGVLIPRPETEELVEKAVAAAGEYDAPVIYDLCSGSGCIGISIAKKCKDATVYCVEKSADAISYLKKNAQGVNNVRVILGDITKPLDLPKADIIVSNPPYIKSGDIEALQSEVHFEPKMALDGGEDGLVFYRAIERICAANLKSGGTVLLETGNEQSDEVKSIFAAYKDVQSFKDIYGNFRIVKAKN